MTFTHRNAAFRIPYTWGPAAATRRKTALGCGVVSPAFYVACRCWLFGHQPTCRGSSALPFVVRNSVVRRRKLSSDHPRWQASIALVCDADHPIGCDWRPPCLERGCQSISGLGKQLLNHVTDECTFTISSGVIKKLGGLVFFLSPFSHGRDLSVWMRLGKTLNLITQADDNRSYSGRSASLSNIRDAHINSKF